MLLNDNFIHNNDEWSSESVNFLSFLNYSVLGITVKKGICARYEIALRYG